MLAVSYRSPATLSSLHPGVMDDPGTINPAALNAPNPTIAPNLLSQPSPRGTKRSRSTDTYGVQGQEAESGVYSPHHDAGGNRQENTPSNKRSRPLKQVDSPTQGMSYTTTQQPVQTPQIKTQSLPQASPSQTSPARSTPGSATKPATIKALPTVRDHTTDQLGPEGDEYLPREIDVDGDAKVSHDGYPMAGRKYRCRTFQVPHRGEKLFMLATECARVLGYRDSYLLFNKNRSLYKIIANQAEKDNLIQQDILPYSYRSRQIAIVTARSMFRQFGSRLVENGRRVRDDYWEAKARKQGFTEEDAAGEKRPGAAKAREAAAAEASSSHAALTSLPQGEIIYNNGPGMDGQPPGLGQVSLAPLPMMQLANEDMRPNSYGNVLRPRQEIVGPPYQDRTQSSNPAEIMNQAAHAVDYQKQLGQTRQHRAKYLDEYWRRPHEQPEIHVSTDAEASTIAPQHLQSPQAVASMTSGRAPQDSISHPGAQMIPQGYQGYPHPHNPMTSPVQTMHRPMSSVQMHPATPMAGQPQRQPSYGGGGSYPPQQAMWQTPQPQPSPLSQSHHPSQQSYAQQQQQQQQQQSPMAPPPPSQQMQQQQQNYAQQLAAQQAAFSAAGGGMARSMYQPSPQQQQQFNMSHGGAGQQGWGTSAPGSGQEWGQQRY